MRLTGFLSLARRFTLRPLLQHPLRSLLTIGGVALGLAVVGAVHLSTNRAVTSFSDSLDLVEGRSDFHVAGNGFSLHETWLEEFAWFWDYGSMAPRLEGRARTSEGTSIRIYGVDLVADGLMRDYFGEPAGGSPTHSRNRLGADSFLELLEKERQIVVPKRLAESQSLEVGSELDLRISGRPFRFGVGAILEEAGMAGAFGGNLVIMDIATAQQVLDRIGLVDRIDFKLYESAPPSVVQRVEDQVAGRLTLYRKGDLARQSSRMLASFQLNLRVLSYLGLMVGVILIYNTIGLSAISRRAEVATLRALGAPTRVVFGLFVAEAVLLGAVGAGAGVMLAPWLSALADQLVSRTVGEFYGGAGAGFSAGRLDTVTLMTLAVAGVSIAVASGLRPAWSATTLSPVEVLREGAWSVARVSRQRGRTLLAVVLVALGSALSFAPPVGGVPLPGYLAGLLLIGGFAVGCVSVLRAVLGLARRELFPRVGVEVRLALRQLEGNADRVTPAVVSLMIAASMFVGVATMVGSFRNTVEAWIDQTFIADLFVRTGGAAGDDWSSPFPAGAIERVRGVPGVAAVGTFRGATIDWEDVQVTLAGAGFEVLEQHGRLLFADARPGARIVREARLSRRVLVSEPFARRFRVAAGDEITLKTPGGPRVLSIEAVYYDYSSDRGVIVMDRLLFGELFQDTGANTLAVYLRPGADTEVVSDRIRGTLPDRALSIQPSRELRASALRVFDRTFQITYALELIALIVAALGVTNTLAALILERKGEFSLLRFLGAFKSQIRRMTLVEAALLGAAGCLLGLALGLLLALLLVYVINLQSFGWTIQFDFPWLFVGSGLALILLVTVLAGIYPALLTSRMDALRALRTG